MRLPSGERAIPFALACVSCFLFGSGTIVTAAPNGANPSPPPANARAGAFEQGEDLFFHETFGGNGRTCSTCHDPRNEFTMSPQLAQQRYQADPTHPLFRPIDSDDGGGNSYATVLDHALFRVTIPLHPNVVILDAPGQRTITVWRGVPTIANVDLTAPFLQDGRASTLQEQALGAIKGHMQPSRKPTAKELDALVAFETEFFYPLRLRALNDADRTGIGPEFSVPVISPAAQRGKAVFDLHCRRCHDGELLDEPSNPSVSHFASAFVSDANTLNLPLFRLGFRQPDGAVIETVSPDPGRAALTGDLDDLNKFDTPALRGLKHTAPYFHDNSADTLEQVIDHYNSSFNMQITFDERDDLLAYLELL